MQLKKLEIWAAKKLLNADDRKRVWLKLAKMLSNNAPIIQAMESLYTRRVTLKGQGDFTALALNDWITKMNNGDPFSEAAKDWLPQQEYMLLMAGTKSGQLEQSFISAAEIMTTMKAIKTAVIGGLAYPVILMILGIGISYLFGVNIFPKFFLIAPEDKWQGFAVHAITFSHLVQDYILYVIAGAAIMITGFFLSLPRWDGAMRIKADQYMPYSLYRTITGSSWLIALSAMVSAGERVEDALIAMSDNSGPWLKNRINMTLNEIRLGHNLGDALHRTGTGFPDPEIIDDLGVYASISGFDEALSTLGKEWSEESVTQIQLKSKIMFVFGLFTVTLLIGFLLAGLLSMQLQLGDIIRR